MNKLSAIVLTKNEQLHIRRCIENLLPICEKIFVIDCFSNDKTISICKEYEKVFVIQRDWPGLYSIQFNWAIDNCPITTKWTIRMDADEYIMPEDREKLLLFLNTVNDSQNALSLVCNRYFLGKRICHGGVGSVRLTRVFRTGKARCEIRNMDEHIILSEGGIVASNIRFADNNMNDISWWTMKHIGYAGREASDLVEIITGNSNSSTNGLNSDAAKKRRLKIKYARKPLFWRSFAYFCYRYFFMLGFLDGKEGFLWHFLQGWWYRTLVDVKILEHTRKERDH